MRVPSEEFNVLTIGVFEDDGESLCFPEEEPLEVDQVHLRSGRQLADPHPPPRKETKLRMQFRMIRRTLHVGCQSSMM